MSILAVEPRFASRQAKRDNGKNGFFSPTGHQVIGAYKTLRKPASSAQDYCALSIAFIDVF